MGKHEDRSQSLERKHKKQKKQKKEKKDKKDKKDKKQKKEKKSKDDSTPFEQESKMITKSIPSNQQSVSHQIKPYHSTGEIGQQSMPLERTYISCRRCKEESFSLKNRTCYKCGYPKEQRPMYFPTVKQVNVLDMVRQGKLVHNSYAPTLIQVVVNDRMGKKQSIKCCPTDSIGDFKKLISAQIGTRPDKIRLQKANIIFKDHLTLDLYEIKDGMSLQMYYD